MSQALPLPVDGEVIEGGSSIGVLLSPIIAAAAMSFSSVSVILNVVRLRGARS